MSGEIILVVEDNTTQRVGICKMLALEGYRVFEARHGKAALEILNEITPDLILSDVMMPEMNGYDLYTKVRNNPSLISIPFIFLTARSEHADFMLGRSLGVDDYLAKPVTYEELITAIQSRLTRYSQVKLAQVDKAYQASLTLLVNAIEFRVLGTYLDSGWLVEFAQIFADYMDWQERTVNLLRFATILHDIGKLTVPEDILLKKEKLSKQDWIQIKNHSDAGAEMVRGVALLSDVAPLIRHHHERWDGRGYPEGLSGTGIPLGSRILAVVDSFDAMISPRVYAPLLSPQQAFDEIINCSGTQFDPTIVDYLKRAWQEGKIDNILTKLQARESSTTT